MRLLPQSLFGRLMLVLASGLIVAQLLSAAINWVERDSLLVRASGMQPVQRIADIVRLLDSLSAAERTRIVAVLNAPPLVVSLDRAPVADTAGLAPRAAMFAAMLQAALGESRPLRVVITGTPVPWAPPAASGWQQGAMGAAMGQRRGEPGLRRFPPAGVSLLIQVGLRDGSWASFETQVTRDASNLPWRVLLSLTILLVAVLLVSFIAVRWVTLPLKLLAGAADELGRDINRPALPESGPFEVRRAAQAFNTMQRRLVQFIDERTRLLTAMSHDLKTPLTRMRLRAEMLEDETLRGKFETDLIEMENMVTQTLAFMRGLSKHEPAQSVDVMALLESLQADNEAMGRSVTIDGRCTKAWQGGAQLLKRCLSNLIDNAVLYGKRAAIHVEENADQLTIRVRDDGPGIPASQLEKVFEPFYRLEGSRSRETGGTGLGLSIARNIAQAHGGNLYLRNHEAHGLEAVLTLPWQHQSAGPAGQAKNVKSPGA